MAKGFYQAVGKLWRKPTEEMKNLLRQRLIDWRKQHTVERIERPTRIDRAHALGYKAKLGFVIARVRVKKGGRRRRYYGRRGRKPSKTGLTQFTAGKSDRWISEEKAQRKFVNLEVLNSYQVGEDGQHKWFEVILLDRNHPQIKADPKINWILNSKNRRRVFHGKTSAGQKARGLK